MCGFLEYQRNKGDLQKVNMEVGWLQQRLDDILKANWRKENTLPMREVVEQEFRCFRNSIVSHAYIVISLSGYL